MLTHQLNFIHDRMVKNHWSVSTAESCTSGRIATLLTSISGASHFFQGGVVAYQNEVKIKELGVNPQTIEQHDVVSCEVVTEMVIGACRKFNTTFAIASTGYAEAWEGHDVHIWIGWGTADDVEVRCLTTDRGRIKNVEEASQKAIEEFAYYLLNR